MWLADEEKVSLLRKCTVSQLKQIAKKKNLRVRGDSWLDTPPKKEDYVDQLYDSVSTRFVKNFLSERSGGGRAVPGKKIPKAKVIRELKKFHSAPRKNESEYERDLLNWARGRFGGANVTPQYSIGRTRIDLVIGGVGVELKAPKTARPLMTLRGQVDVYMKEFGNNLVVVIFDPKCDPSVVYEFETDMKKKGITVLVKK